MQVDEVAMGLLIECPKCVVIEIQPIHLPVRVSFALESIRASIVKLGI